MKKLLWISFWIAYALAVLSAIAFVVLLVLSWFARQELAATNPLALIGPFSIVVKHWAKRLLLPSVLFAVLGYVLQRIYNARK